MASDFAMYSGDSRSLTISIMDEEGGAADLEFVQAVRFGLFDGPESVFVKSLGDGVTVSGDIVTVTLLPADTAELEGFYTHELEIIDAVGRVYTALQGRATIYRDYLT